MSLRSFGRCLAVLALLALPATLAAQQGSKIAYINSRTVLLATPGYAQAESTYNKEFAGFRAEVEGLQNSLDSMAADFEQKSVMLSATAKNAKRKELEDRMKEIGIPLEELWWYLDTRRYGTVPHAGFGLGFERMVQFVTGMTNIRDVIPFPRTPKNADF